MKNIVKEADFHNDRLEKEDGNDRLSYSYASVADVLSIPTNYFNSNSPSTVMEIGCFDGVNALLVGGNYIGIDISDKAIAHAQRKYSNDKRKFIVWDAHKLDELNIECDYIFGNGIIHHCDIPILAASLALTIAKGGTACFLEPMKGPPWLRLFRYFTPSIRTEDELPLTAEQIKIFENYFDVEEKYFAISRPILPMIFGNQKIIIRLSSKLDKLFSRVAPRLYKRWAWLVVLTLKSKK